MFFNSIVLLALLGLSAAFSLRNEYHGPPAPLNHDGTVAHTPEFEHVSSAHKAALAEEFQRLHEVDALAAAHPDLTSPPDHYEGQHLSKHEDYNHPYPSSSFSYNTQAHHQEPSSYKYNPEAHIPAPLNHDGTVAHTDAYKAIAAEHHAEHHKSHYRHRRSYNYYKGPPAPLNHDDTVAHTPEFEHVSSAHKAAFAEEFQRLHETEALAAAHPDLTSPVETHSEYNEHYYPKHYSNEHFNFESEDGHYVPQIYEHADHASEELVKDLYSLGHQSFGHQAYDEPSHKYNPEAHIPAPLNHDGTVAHTHEYNAIAAEHEAEHHKALFRHRRSANYYQGPPAPLNHDGTVAHTPEFQHISSARNAAFHEELQKLHEAEALANAYPDHTSAGNYHDNGHYDTQLYSNNQEQSYKYNPEAHIPAPLNHDGTVAHTHEYKAIAAEHEAERAKALYNKHHGSQTYSYNHQQASRRSYDHEPSSYKYSPEAHIPAPLNHDGTVAHTPAYKAIASAHHAEHAKALHNKDYGSGAYYNQEASRRSYEHEPSSYKYNPESHIPAPLNHDGTVAHTYEYKAIAAEHEAERKKIIGSLKHQDNLSLYLPESMSSHYYL